ncbi:MAG: TMEM165/GDT1 family protein, partial [Negativicutes bacterium]|nr:TMEM165/GDT1 family protein [Negativicutes bacterium]
MEQGVTAFLISLVAVALAEMGDKTQLLAMAFAARYRSSSVLLGVFLATVLNHALAVAAGYWLASLVTVREWVEGLAAVSFVLFGLWTIRGDSLSGQEGGVGRYGPVLTVAVAFFLAEMGDKTQLATVSLATRFPEWPLAVLIGTTAGMLVADAFGIVVGVMLC